MSNHARTGVYLDRMNSYFLTCFLMVQYWILWVFNESVMKCTGTQVRVSTTYCQVYTSRINLIQDNIWFRRFYMQDQFGSRYFILTKIQESFEITIRSVRILRVISVQTRKMLQSP